MGWSQDDARAQQEDAGAAALVGLLDVAALAGRETADLVPAADGVATSATGTTPPAPAVADGPAVAELPAAVMGRAFDEAPVGMLLTRHGRIVRVNRAHSRLLGWAPEDLVGRTPASLVVPEDQEASRRALRRAEDGHDGPAELRRVLTAAGSVIEVEVRLTRLTAGDDAPWVLLHVVDRTAEQSALRAQARALDQFESSFVRAPIGMCLVGLEGRLLRVNRALCDVLGRDEADLLLRGFQELTHPDDLDADLKLLQDTLAGRRDGYTLDKRYLRPDGRVVQARLAVSLVRDDDGQPSHFVSQVVDLTALMDAHASRRERDAARELFKTAFASAPIGMLITKRLADGRTAAIQCNDAMAAMVGRRPEDLIGVSGADLVVTEDLPERRRMLEDLHAGRPASGELRLQHADGREVWAQVVPALVDDVDGLALYVLQAVDISERKRFEQRLRHLADHDALTGLLSRRRFEEELAREVTRVSRHGAPAALLLLDLDGFKYVNDSFGHPVGDDLLSRLAGVLRAQLRETDLLARLGGDEFAVLLPDTDAAGGLVVADELIAAVRANGTVRRGERRVSVTASVGLTALGGEDGGAERALVQADVAMYEAKEQGRDRVASYEHAEQRHEQLLHRNDWIGRLRDAIRDESFELVAQPVIALAAAGAEPDAEHYELLLRLRDGDGGLVAPGEFLYHAERDGLVVEVDRWVLRRAVRLLHTAHRDGRALSLAVNFSARTVQDPTIAADLVALLEREPIRAGSLLIEVTETAAITNVARAAELAQHLRTLGCQLALDDFGAGFASFYYLKHLVFDVLKIDGDFVDRLTTTPVDRLVVQSVVSIADGLGVRLIAERVPDQATADLLAELGVGYGQGYFLGRPEPLPTWGLDHTDLTQLDRL